MVRNKEYIIVEANILYRLNPLAPYIWQLVLLTIKTTLILFFIYKLRQARYLTKERIKECKENNYIYPFLSINRNYTFTFNCYRVLRSKYERR